MKWWKGVVAAAAAVALAGLTAFLIFRNKKDE